MALMDLPALIEYILNMTKHKQLIYIGHSQGGTLLTILLSEHPEYNSKIASAHLIAGAIIMSNTVSKLLAPIVKNMKQLKVF